MKQSWLWVLAAMVILAVAAPAAAEFEDSSETRLEQQRAREAELNGVPSATGVVVTAGPDAPGDLLFIGVDDTTISTYNVNPADGAAYPQFTGYQVWGAALIPDPTPGNGVVYFNNGSSLYRWPANGSPELCCTMTFGGSNQSMVSATYEPTLGRLLMTKNIATEAVYALPVVAASCPVSCEVTQEIVYDAGLDIGGLAWNPSDGLLYGTDDGTNDSVVRINADGSVTVIAPYPAGQTDIDGLAAGDGKLYLITDEPGSIYVLDITTATYETPIPNPWTTSEVFCGGALGQGLIPVELQSLTVD
jgi:hypothetical protein